MKKNAIYKIVPSCELVIGIAFSALYDLDRFRLVRFESAFVPIAEEMKNGGLSLKDLEGLKPIIREKVEEFVDRLLIEDMLYVDNDLHNPPFKTVSDAWDPPNEIINCIIDVAEKVPDWDELVSQLEELKCEALQIRCYSNRIDLDAAASILRTFHGSSVSHVELILKSSNDIDEGRLRKLFDDFPALVSVMIHSSDRNAQLELTSDDLPIQRVLIWQKKPLLSEKQCGVVNENMMDRPSPKLCGEKKNFQGCLNRKVSIRSDGQMCNCPSLKKNYGTNLSQLADVVRSKSFQEVWHIKNDMLDVCKNCEFRYVCTGCRAYLESPTSLKKPAKCRYDPTSGTWEEALRS
ncbi:grasp-with-spasm system SPASM domain peptide maturase [Hellea sp.]|nr:grasp-with-spasm system SPASM domain peptide maturase [Hellea sp.]